MASTYYSESQAVGSGTLYYTVGVTSGTCYYEGTTPPKPISFTIYDYELFSYTDSNNISWGLTGGGTYNEVNNSYGSPNNCPTPGTNPSQITLTGGWGFNVNFDLCDYETCPASYATVPAGYVDPKYIVSSEVYAPPGEQSYVEYGSDHEVGNTTSVANSFTSTTAFSETNSTGFNFSLSGVHDGKLTDITTTSATKESSQTTGASSSWTTNLVTMSSYKVYGGPVTYNGWFNSGFNPHDSDMVWLWLDAALPFNSPSSSNQISFGYSWDACDPVEGLDIDYFRNGSLENGGSGVPGVWQGVIVDGTLVAPLARNWATNPSAYAGEIPSDCDGQTFPSGDSSALTSTDFADILAVDPLLNESYQLNLKGQTTGDGRYTRSPAFIDPSTQTIKTTTTDFPFNQASCAGCQATPVTYDAELEQSSGVGSSTDYKTSQTFGVDNVFSGSLWHVQFSSSLSQSNTLTTDYMTKTNLTTSTTTYGKIYIVGPPCDQLVDNVCDPHYNGPTEFDVYQDNKFGTFMFWPIQ